LKIEHCNYQIKNLNLKYLYVQLKKGALFNSQNKLGLSHLYEHLFFKSNNFEKFLIDHNILFDAQTTYDNILIEFIFEDSNEEELFTRIKNNLQDLKISKENFNNEKEIIFNEIACNRNIENLALNSIFANYYGYKNDVDIILGNEETINNIKIEDLENFTEETNVVFHTFSRDLTKKNNIKVINKKYIEEKELQGIQKLACDGKAVCFFYKCGKKDINNYLISELLNVFLASENGILFKNIREKLGLSYNLWSNSFCSNEDIFIFGFIETLNKNKVLKVLKEIFSDTKNKLIDSDYFESLKRKIFLMTLYDYDKFENYDFFIDFGFYDIQKMKNIISKISIIDFNKKLLEFLAFVQIVEIN